MSTTTKKPVMVEMTAKIAAKDKEDRVRKFTIDQAKALLKGKKPQWKLTDKAYKLQDGDIVKA
jgi:hypothetical protein